MRCRRILGVLLVIMVVPREYAAALEIKVIHWRGNWGTEPEETNPRKQAFNDAKLVYERQLTGEYTVEIDVAIEGTGTGAICGAKWALVSNPEDPVYRQKGVPVPLYLQEVGPNGLPPGPHGEITFCEKRAVSTPNGPGAEPYPWYFGDTHEPHSALLDFRTVAMHELGHLLGFASRVIENGGFNTGIPSVFDYCLGYDEAGQGDIEPLMKLQRRGEAADYIKLGTGNEGWIFWNQYDTGDPEYEASRRYVRSAMEPHVHLPLIRQCGYVQIYTPRLWEPMESMSHWSPGLAGDLLMAEPPQDDLFNERSIVLQDADITVLALGDMGWDIDPTVVTAIEERRFSWELTGAKSTPYPSAPVPLINHGDSPLDILEVSLIGNGADQFQLGGEISSLPTVLSPYHHLNVEAAFAPSLLGYHQAYVLIGYSRDGHQGRAMARLIGFAVGEDADGDGISDVDETRDLDPVEPGVQNPFDPNTADSIGYNGLPGADGLTDDLNDWDADGVCNRDEFLQGFNPDHSADCPEAPPDDGISYYVTISNPAYWDMHITGVEVIGTDAAHYFITSGGNHRTVSAHSQTAIGVAYLPLTGGEHSDAQLVVEYDNGVEEKTHIIDLSGTGVYPQS